MKKKTKAIKPIESTNKPTLELMAGGKYKIERVYDQIKDKKGRIMKGSKSGMLTDENINKNLSWFMG